MAKNKDPNKGPKRAEDDTLWALAMGDVKPLKGKARPGGGEKKERGAREIVPALRKKEEEARTGKGIDRRTDERLKKGKMEIDARIYLHGMRLAEAEKALIDILQKSYRQGKRCVLVITGKGMARAAAKPENEWWEGKAGAIRNFTPEWLSRKPLSDIVLRFYPAKQHDGGSGALYVLLRRKR